MQRITIAPRYAARAGRQTRGEATARLLNLNSGVASGQGRAQALDGSCGALAVLLEHPPR